MAGTGITVHGTAAVRAKLAALAKQTPQALAGALRLEAEATMTESKRDYVPVAPALGGTLRDSGTVHPVEVSEREVSVTLSYGGPATPYALAVHEHPSGHSPRSWQGKAIQWSKSGTGPKYLEIPVLNRLKVLATNLGRHLQGTWGR